MTVVEVIVASSEEGFDGIAEFWYGGEQIGLTLIHEAVGEGT
jgi:hypothetical protein